MSQSRRPLLLGHRGARAVKSIPENTFASFDCALADGCDGFEFDVRLTADGQAVICHDPKFGGIEIAAATTTHLAQLPRLDEVLFRYQKNAFLDIELKVSGLETITLALLQKFPPHRGVVISSFLPEVLRTVRSVDSGVPLGLICETRSELRVWRDLALEYLIPHQKLATTALVHELKNAGKRILVWTVNTPTKMLRCRDLGVHGLISDDTELLHRTLS